MPANAEIRKALEERIGLSELEERLREKQGASQGLLDEDAALVLLAAEEGLLKKHEVQAVFAKLEEGARVWFTARVRKVFPEKTFSKKTRAGRVARMAVSNLTGSATLVLWDDRARFASEKGVEEGDLIEVRNARVLKGEIHAGEKTRLSVQRLARFSFLKDLEERKPADVFLRVLQVLEAKPFKKKGARQWYSSFIGGDESGFARVVCWDSWGSLSEKLSLGDSVELKNAFFKDGEVHANAKTRLAVNPKRQPQPVTRIRDLRDGLPAEIRGDIDGARADGETLVLEVTQGKAIECVFPSRLARQLLGASHLPQDIPLSLILKLAKDLRENTIRLRGTARKTEDGMQFEVEKEIDE